MARLDDLAACASSLCCPTLVIGGNTSLREIPSLQRIQFLGESVTVMSGIPNPFTVVGWITVLLILVFVADASRTAWRRGDRRKALVVGGSVEFFLVMGLATSALLLWGPLEVPLALSLCYQGLVAVMGYELTRDLLRASQLVRELRGERGRAARK